jgi:hypothetical protein
MPCEEHRLENAVFHTKLETLAENYECSDQPHPARLHRWKNKRTFTKLSMMVNEVPFLRSVNSEGGLNKVARFVPWFLTNQQTL